MKLFVVTMGNISDTSITCCPVVYANNEDDAEAQSKMLFPHMTFFCAEELT